MRGFAWALLWVALAQPAAAQIAAPDLSRAEALIREGKAEEAWQLLAPHEPRHAGRPAYDYLLGTAALESGRAALATFILERVIVVNPGHSAARLEMARSYFALHDYERAEREFKAVLGADPPPAIRALVLRYLDRMRAQAPPSAAPALHGYAELTLGRDSNVNAATSAGGVLVAAPAAGREADGFSALGAGLEYSSAGGERHTLFAAADFAQRTHFDLDRFDSRAADLSVGLQTRLDERERLRLALEHNEYDLDHSRFRRTQGAAAQWSRELGAQARVSLFGQALRIRYLDEATQSESSDLALAGVRGVRSLDRVGRTLGSASLYFGSDHATSGRLDGDRRLLGLSGTLQRRLRARLEGYASLSIIESDYRQQDAAAGLAREDRYISAELGLSWRLRGGWSAHPRVSRTHNRSNLPRAEYGRTEASLSLRRVWQ